MAMAAAALVFAGRLVRLQGVKNGSTGFLLEDFGRRLLTTRASSSSSSLFAAAVVGSGSQRPFPLATWKTPTSRFEDVFHWRRRLLSSAAESEPEAKDSSQNQKKLDSAALLKVHSANALDASGPREKKWPHKVISVRRTAKITKAGVLNSFSAFVIVGNKKGLIGYGKGKSNSTQNAIERAYRNAISSLIAIELFDGHTIYHDIEHKFKKTKVVLRSGKQGSGIIANELVATICSLAGIQNLSAKVHGVRHKRNTVRAVFEALEMVQSVEEMKRARGADLRLY